MCLTHVQLKPCLETTTSTATTTTITTNIKEKLTAEKKLKCCEMSVESHRVEVVVSDVAINFMLNTT